MSVLLCIPGVPGDLQLPQSCADLLDLPTASKGDFNDAAPVEVRAFSLESFQWGVGRGISSASDEGRTMSRLSCSEVTCSLPMTARANLLQGLAIGGALFDFVDVFFIR
jgi:hypothetical protein